MFRRYALVGALGFALNIALSALLHELLGLPEEVAYAIALVVVILVNFFLARRYIYQSTGDVASEFMRFTISAAGFRLVEYCAFLLLHTVAGIYYLLAIAIVTVASFLLKYFVYDKFVFNGVEKNR